MRVETAWMTNQDGQYIQDKNSNTPRNDGLISTRWDRHFFTLLNATSATIDRTIIERIAQRLLALSPGDPLSPSATAEAPRTMSSGKATSTDSLLAEILKLGLNGKGSKILRHLHSIVCAVWVSDEVAQKRKDITIKVCTKKKGPRVVATGNLRTCKVHFTSRTGC